MRRNACLRVEIETQPLPQPIAFMPASYPVYIQSFSSLLSMKLFHIPVFEHSALFPPHFAFRSSFSLKVAARRHDRHALVHEGLAYPEVVVNPFLHAGRLGEAL